MLINYQINSIQYKKVPIYFRDSLLGIRDRNRDRKNSGNFGTRDSGSGFPSGIISYPIDDIINSKGGQNASNEY